MCSVASRSEALRGASAYRRGPQPGGGRLPGRHARRWRNRLASALGVILALIQTAVVAKEAASSARLVDASQETGIAIFAVDGELVPVRQGEMIADTRLTLVQVTHEGVLLALEPVDQDEANPSGAKSLQRLISLAHGETTTQRSAALLAGDWQQLPAQIEFSAAGAAPGGRDE